jgi:hypothetical protein
MATWIPGSGSVSPAPGGTYGWRGGGAGGILGVINKKNNTNPHPTS